MNIIKILLGFKSSKYLLAGLMSAAVVFSAYASPDLENFTTICTLDENCAVDERTLVAFGAEGEYVYKTLSGNFLCSAKTFGVKVDETQANSTCLSLNPDIAQETAKTIKALTQKTTYRRPIPTGLYAIISVYSGKALTIEKNDLNDGAVLIQQDFSQQSNQLWNIEDLQNGFYSITANHSGKALENQGWNVYDGAKLQQFSWINSLNQHWKIKKTDEDSYQISSRVNGHVIDLFEMNKMEDGDVCLWTYWGGSNQHWRVVPVEVNTSSSSASETE